MSNGDATQGHAVTPEEFAKLMGAYPQPAENPLPTYGGYMDNSPANFSWVQNNDYFGAEMTHKAIHWDDVKDKEYKGYEKPSAGLFGIQSQLLDEYGDVEDDDFMFFPSEQERDAYLQKHGAESENVEKKLILDMKKWSIKDGRPDGKTITWKETTEFSWSNFFQSIIEGVENMNDDTNDDLPEVWFLSSTPYRETLNSGEIRYGAEIVWFDSKGRSQKQFYEDFMKANRGKKYGDMFHDSNLLKYGFGLTWSHEKGWAAETFEAPYGGAGSLMDIGKATPLADFTDEELTTSSAIHGDFDQASLNYSGHQNIEVRAEMEFDYTENQEPKKIFPNIEHWKDMDDPRLGYTEGGDIYDETFFVDIPNMQIYSVKFYFDDGESKKAVEWAEENLGLENQGIAHDKFNYDPSNPSGYLYYVGYDSLDNPIEIHKAPFLGMEIKKSDRSGFKMAEMEIIDESNARIKNRFGDEIGMVGVDDHDVEDAVVEVSDGSDVIQEVIISEAETKKSSMLPLAIGMIAGVLAFPKVTEFFTKNEEKAADTPEMDEIELIENPNTGNLDPAQYEEMVVESTGFAVDVIPQVLDGSFMGSRFQALPTERYVDYNEPGIGAHTDIAMNRNTMYLEPEMAMVQASENVIKEAQAPGQSPYNSTTGEENPDFDMRVLKETEVVSLDPAVKPFIPQSMSGYTGNANTPPSVLNKMFNTGVLGQTPAFVPGSGDMGASRTGSRNSIPNTLGLGGSVGGPLSDQVNASYTDGTTSMSLAQWSIENTVSQTSDTEAVVIDRSSGLMKRVRRV
tara:strand:+ start:2232 stop:4610 length:2379 start_codon:yes stop_codon:yes gene_type:complete